MKSIIALLALVALVHAQVDDCACDIALVLDDSGSISEDDFKDVKDFAKQIVTDLGASGKLGTGDDKSRVGILYYSSDVTIASQMDYDVQKLNAAIDQIPKQWGTTNTADAIQKAADMLIASKQTKTSCVTIKLVTDGMSDDGDQTIINAANAKKAGITILAVGVGDGVNMTEIKTVASEPITKNALKIDDFSSLSQIAHALFDKCTSNPPPLPKDQQCTCDVMMVLDSSGSISPTDWLRMKDFARIFVHAYKSRMLKGQVRLGAITYSSTTYLISGLTYDPNALLAAINRAPKLDSTTDTAAAIEMAGRELLTSQKKDIVCQTIKVVTDGNSDDPQRTAQIAYDLKNKKQMNMLAVGIGAVDMKELTALASEPLSENAIPLQDFTNLTRVAHALADDCDEDANDTKTPDPVADECKCDLYLIMDSSGSISANDWQFMVKFAQTMVDNVRNFLGDDDVRVTIIEYSTTTRVVVKSSYNYNEISGALVNMRSMSGVTNTHLALQLARQLMLSEPGNNRNCRMVKVLTDGASTAPAETVKAAHLLKAVQDARVFAVGVGNQAQQAELQQIASPPVASNVLNNVPFSQLQQIANQMTQKCGRTLTPSPKLKTLTPIPPPVPDQCKCDIVILLDTSGSISVANFVKVQDFARVLIRDLRPQLVPGGARIALARFSTDAQLLVALTTDTTPLLRAVQDMKPPAGTTRTDLGIYVAQTELTNSPRSAPQTKCKTVYLFTDGYSTVPAATLVSAHRAKAYGITILVIGVAPANQQELALVSSGPGLNNVIYLKDFSGLESVAHALGDKCNTKGTTTPTLNPFAYDPCACDYIMVLDNSNSIGKFSNLITFAKTIVGGLRQSIQQGKSRVAVITYNAAPSIRIPMSSNYDQLMNSISAMSTSTAGGSNTASALAAARGEFDRTSKGIGTCKKLILVSDGYSNCAGGNAQQCKAAVILQAHVLKSQTRVMLHVFGTGGKVDWTELSNIASAPAADNARILKDFDDLSVVAQLLTGKCTTAGPGAPSPYSVDCKCDIALVLDKSGSIPTGEMQKMRLFCSSFINGIQKFLQSGDSRVAIVAFDSTPTVVQPLTSDYNTLLNKCMAVGNPGGGTATNLALQVAGQQLNAGQRACKSIKLMTDGNSNSPKATDAVAEQLKLVYNIYIQAVGIGNNINMNELRDVVTAPQTLNAIKINDFNALNQIAQTMTSKCNNPVYNQQSQCNFQAMVRCTMTAGNACTRINNYQTCSNTYKCPDLLKVWCANIFAVSSMYRSCAAYNLVCGAANLNSKCSVNLYNDCYKNIQNQKGVDDCTRQNRFIWCAESSVCPDLVAYQCGAGGAPRGCTLTSCSAFNRQAVDAAALENFMSEALPSQRGQSVSGVVVVLAALVAVLVGALVVLVVKYRQAVQSEREESLLSAEAEMQ